MLHPILRSSALALLAILALHGNAARADNIRQAPTHKDVAYDRQHGSQKLDVYLAKSDKPVPVMVFFHGGGWSGGSKAYVPSWLMKGVREGAFSVVSVEYRFTQVAIHPAQANDCMRAVQFVRANAAKWNIDPKRVGVTGSSAGAHLAMWVGLHDDAADAAAQDPIQKESSRVACVVDFAGSTDWSLLAELPHGHPGYRQAIGYPPGTPAKDMDAKAKADVSPITFASAGDPPVMLIHGDKDDVVPFKHAENMVARLKAVGVRADLVTIHGAGHGVAGAEDPEGAKRATAFVHELLLGERP